MLRRRMNPLSPPPDADAEEEAAGADAAGADAADEESPEDAEDEAAGAAAAAGALATAATTAASGALPSSSAKALVGIMLKSRMTTIKTALKRLNDLIFFMFSPFLYGPCSFSLVTGASEK